MKFVEYFNQYHNMKVQMVSMKTTNVLIWGFYRLYITWVKLIIQLLVNIYPGIMMYIFLCIWIFHNIEITYHILFRFCQLVTRDNDGCLYSLSMVLLLLFLLLLYVVFLLIPKSDKDNDIVWIIIVINIIS